MKFPLRGNFICAFFVDHSKMKSETEREIERLRQEIARFKAITDCVPNAMVTISSDGSIQSVNRSTVKMFGYSEEELLSQNVSILMPEPHRSQHQEYIANYLRTGTSKIIGIGREVVAITKSGELIPVFLSLGEAEVDGEKIFAGILHDLRERTALEQELTEISGNVQLKHDELHSLEKAVTHVSHELRTPLNGILSLVELVLRSSSLGELKEDLEAIQSSSLHLKHVIDNVLMFSKLDSEGFSLDQEEVELYTLLSGIATGFSGEQKRRDIEVVMHVEDDVPEIIVTNGLALRQILTNLVGNAFKFSDTHGGIVIFVELTHEQNGTRNICFSVADTGVGVPRDALDSIFEPFGQSKHSTGAEREGTGLGLSIVKSLVDELGGNIWLRSIEGVGAAFHVTLPLDAQQRSKTPRQSQISCVKETELGGDALKILLVDDNETNRKIVTRLLTSEGHQVLEATHGAEALCLLERNKHIDLILMDLQMPILDGIETTRQIRSSGAKWSNLPIIALTARALPGDEAACLRVGMNDYLSKPFEFSDLISSIGKATHDFRKVGYERCQT